jgi:Zn-dependent peptidase ImmA (M78 family)
VFELSHFYNYCQKNNVEIISFDGMPAEGLTMRIREDYAIFLDFSQIQSARLLKGICYHELGHAGTGALHKVSSPYETVERSEYRANRWAAEHFLPPEEFREAFANGYTELWQLAEYFDLPEQDIKNALTYWTERRNINFNK